jgi:hypothetical protein
MEPKLTGISLKSSGLEPALLAILPHTSFQHQRRPEANCLRFTVALPPISFLLPTLSENDRSRRYRIATATQQLTEPNAATL